MAHLRTTQPNEALEERLRKIEGLAIDLDGTAGLLIGAPQTKRVAKLRPGETLGETLLRLFTQKGGRIRRKRRSSCQATPNRMEIAGAWSTRLKRRRIV